MRTLMICLVVLSVWPNAESAVFGQPQIPSELNAMIQKAQTLLGQQKFADAELVMESATKSFSEHPAGWYFLGYSRHAQKKHEAALKAYEKANRLAKGKAPNALYNMACIFAIKNEKDRAFEFLDRAVKAGFSNFGHMHGDSDLINLRSDKRFKKYKPKWLPDDQLFIESTRILGKWEGENAGDQFGWTARRVGDIDKDGVIDFVTTAPTYGNGNGKIYVYSSKTRKLIHSIKGDKGFRLGNSAVGIGDINDDDIPDFIAGAPQANGKGAAFVYSGKDSSVVHRIDGQTQGGQFGYEVSELGDINGDEIPDFLVGELNGNGNSKSAGRAVVYSGKSSEKLFELKGEKSGDNFGNAAAATKVQDNEFLLAIGAQNAGPSNRGRVYVYQVKHAKPKLKFTIDGDKNSVNLGQMFISFPGDLNRDGVPDVYASDFSDNTHVTGGGKVVVHSGADGKQLLEIHGQQKGEGLGTSPSDAGDVDGDGIGDLVVGAWQNGEGAKGAGKVYLYSSAKNGKLLRSWTCRQAGDTLGFDACGIGDVDGDGAVDFLLTSAWSAIHGEKTGRVFIVAGEKYAKSDATTNQYERLVAGNVTTVLDDIDGGTGGLNIDEEGRLYTADFGWRLGGGGKGGNKIFRVTDDGQSELFFSQLRGGSGNTFGPDGNLFQSNIGGNTITRISADGKSSKIFCNTGLRNPVGLAFNSKGSLFACNCGNNSIQKISQDGRSTVFCRSSLLKCPNGIAIGPDDDVYICNFSNGDVIKIDAGGNAAKLATLPGNNNGHLIYHLGYLYVLARKDGRVYQVDLAGRVRVFAGNGKRGKTNGKAMESSFSLPNSLIVSKDGKWMYVNETSPVAGDHRILGPTRIRRIELIKAITK